MESPKVRSSCCGLVLLLLLQLIFAVRFSHAQSGQLKWSPSPTATGPGEGLKAFELVQDDPAHVEPGVKHIFVQGDHYRVNMDLKEHDTHPDRQRNEVAGMVDTSGKAIQVLEGETWRVEHSMFIPYTLNATTSFTHIMQLLGQGGPLVTIDLRKTGGKPTIALNIIATKKNLVSTPLTPLQNTWIHSSLTFQVKTSGTIHWVLKDSEGRTVVNAQGKNQPLYTGSLRVRPKWGIYRSLSDKADLQVCYLLLKNFRAFKLS